MADFLSGISVGAHQGLANLVQSKRANRQMARENRRYENDLLYRLGSTAAAQKDRERTFAYQKTRDTVRDQQWADQISIRGDELELSRDRFGESKRATLARETQARTDAASAEARHDEGMQYKWAVHYEDQEQEDARLAEVIASRESAEARHDESMQAKWDMHHEDQEQEDARLSAQVNRDATTKQYYEDSIRLQEKRLNAEPSELERQKIQAEIKRLKAHTGLYEAQAADVGNTRRSTTPPASWIQTRDLATSIATEYAKQFADRGAAFTFNPVGTDLGGRLTREKILPFTESTPLPYDEASGGEPGQPTQVSEIQRMGGEVFERLWRQTDDIDSAFQQLDSTFDAILNDETYGGKVRNYMREYGPENAEQELRRYFLKGGLAASKKIEKMMTTSPDASTPATSPSEQIPIGPRF